MAEVSPDLATGRLRNLFEAAGATWLDLPVLQPADAFLETAGEDVRRRMFVTEGGRGERLALRPDFTIPVCLHHLENGLSSKRYAYEGAVFRRRVSGPSELLETGYEDIGRTDRTVAEVDALVLATRAVSALTGMTPALLLGDIGLFDGLLNALDLPPAWRRRLRLSFGTGEKMAANLVRLAEPTVDRQDDTASTLDKPLAEIAATHDAGALTAALQARFIEHGHASADGRPPEEIARRFLEQQSLRETHLDADRLKILHDYLSIKTPFQEAGQVLSDFARQNDFSFGSALEQFRERADLAGNAGISQGATFAAAFGRPLDYYTGLVFELRLAGDGDPIAGGGRYDGLMQLLGTEKQVPAIGFSVRLSAAGIDGGAS